MADTTELKRIIAGYSNQHLLEQFYQRKQDYGEAALATMEEEIKRRNIPASEVAPYASGDEPGKRAKRAYKIEEFTAFADVFTPMDIILVNAMFGEANIPFFVDNPPSSAFPTTGMADTFLKIHVHKDHIAQAHAILDEHFEKTDGKYRPKTGTDLEQLKTLNFHEFHAKEADQIADMGVILSPAEAAATVILAKRLLAEVDKIESSQDRIIFCLENIGDLVTSLESNPGYSLTKNDFFTITEILQVYCDDPLFPPVLNETVQAILAFFREQK
jgi:hypothetical protein